MATLLSNEIKKGKVIFFNNEPTLILSHEFSKTGRAGSVNRTKVKGLKSKVIKNVTFAGREKVEEVEVLNRNIQYMYLDNQSAFFMDPETFDQIEINVENIPNGKSFLKEGLLYQGVFYEGEIISLILPKKVTLEVIEAPDGVKGDSASNPQKKVTVETDYVLNTPLFISKGDLIIINTETGLYDSKG